MMITIQYIETEFVWGFTELVLAFEFKPDILKALTDHLVGGSRVDSFDPQW